MSNHNNHPFNQDSVVSVLESFLGHSKGSKRLMLVAGAKGIGKNSILTQIAIDHLLQGEQIIHCSFVSSVDDLMLHYDTLALAMSEQQAINLTLIKEIIAKNRMLLSFNEIDINTIKQSINDIKQSILPNIIMLFIEGFNFDNHLVLQQIKAMGFEVWTDATLERGTAMVPPASRQLVDQIIWVEQDKRGLTLKIEGKAEVLPIIFNPTTALLMKDN